MEKRSHTVPLRRPPGASLGITEADIRRLVVAFYSEACADERIGPGFEGRDFALDSTARRGVSLARTTKHGRSRYTSSARRS